MAITPIIASGLSSQGRVNRYPKHNFQIRQQPWQIVPFMIAPVLPGETLKNMLVQARVRTDPVKSPLLGWWYEQYFFYVKHRDLDERDTYTAMMLEYGTDVSALKDVSVNTAMYSFEGGMKFTRQCLKRVTEEYFRDEGEAETVAAIGGYYAAKVSTNKTWLDSVTTDTAFDTSGSAQDGTETLQELNAMQEQWLFMRQQNLTNMTYEEFLATYGVRQTKTQLNRPELIRYVRDWKYPSNVIDPADGSAASAIVWDIAERADKDRFFTEPGFIFGVSVARPKVYFSGQSGSAVGMLNDALAWLPALMRDDPASSLKKVLTGSVDGSGPLPAVTDDYWVDLRDLFLYGDQFVNFALTETDAGLVALPTAGMVKDYATAAMADALFSSAAPANQIRSDGTVALTIAGTQVDHT